ncbi:hypothetical protein HNQ93_003331 [Hymenobacter luteus]|uniref:STAS/SEC14 domain-containing protein n=2 Tax=Hymenobacter TaxID=89966 RepID=A0A7W9WE98_9BACT|nr:MULTISPECIES: STAS/SEC14 domain-containing protein [Hymenobacter]MBB4602566.1 hypothetical protein [Hymenobacter latericoloratus]MBB6060457.1 hypothetical protein [Hymenobacter luteus]
MAAAYFLHNADLLILENQAGKVVYHSAGYVRLDWYSTPASDAEVQRLYEAASEALLQYGVTGILTDHRDMRPLSADLQHWLVSTWTQQAVQDCGYQRAAVVQSFNVFSRLAAAQVVMQLGRLPLTVKYFDNEAEAESWLLEE